MQAGSSARQLISSRGRGAVADDGPVPERRLFQRILDHVPFLRTFRQRDRGPRDEWLGRVCPLLSVAGAARRSRAVGVAQTVSSRPRVAGLGMSSAPAASTRRLEAGLQSRDLRLSDNRLFMSEYDSAESRARCAACLPRAFAAVLLITRREATTLKAIGRV